MKVWVYVILFVVLLSSAYAVCEPKEKFIDRIQDNCEAEDSICNDAEIPFRDNDCALSLDAFGCKNDRCIFEEIWFAKLIIIAIIFMGIRYKKGYGVFIIISFIYLAMTFFDYGYITIENPVNTTLVLTDEQINSNILLRYGSIVYPSRPIVGIIIILGALFLVVRLLSRRFQWPRKRY